jgi:uncharacterized membrane protein (DUF373 family)
VATVATTETHLLLRLTGRFKRFVAGVLLVLMAVVVSIAVVELVLVMLPGRFAVEASAAWMTEAQLLDIFGVFLTVLIALELVETVEIYFRKHVIHAEVVLLVAVIALGRKFILLDPKAYKPLTLLALAAITLALGVSYFLLRRAGASEQADSSVGAGPAGQ